MKTSVKILIISLLLFLGSCATSNYPQEEGGIGGTGNSEECTKEKQNECLHKP